MISFTGLHPMVNRDWLMQMPFILLNACCAGLLGAAFNSMRMWLWKLRASKTRHCLRIGEVVGLALLCGDLPPPMARPPPSLPAVACALWWMTAHCTPLTAPPTRKAQPPVP